MFSLESLKFDFSNPMIWGGLVLMVVAIIGYFWMSTKTEAPVQQQQPPSVSFAPTVHVMEMDDNSQQPQYQEPQQDQPTVATCMVNDAGEQVCA